jgi:DNA-directed RNA polymerase subunit RPC12/RpoP
MPTYSYRCLRCGTAFDIYNIPYPPPPTVAQQCPRCVQEVDTLTGGRTLDVAERVWLPGSWTVQGSGIFQPHFDHGLGVTVESKRHQEEVARKAGLVPKGTTSRVPRKLAVTGADIERGIRDLKTEHVARMRERREHLDYCERNGLPVPGQK